MMVYRRLSKKQKKEVIELFYTGKFLLKELAQKYQVSESSISLLITAHLKSRKFTTKQNND
jgi:Putative helix-turn-helix protein, YlxM / p13 like.